jgi:hypothetical protein
VGQEGKFSRNDFRFDKDNDLYVCPNGKEMGAVWNVVGIAVMVSPAG